jgi:hypothetical protein
MICLKIFLNTLIPHYRNEKLWISFSHIFNIFHIAWHNENNKALAQLAGIKNVPRLMPVALIEVFCLFYIL